MSCHIALFSTFFQIIVSALFVVLDVDFVESGIAFVNIGELLLINILTFMCHSFLMPGFSVFSFAKYPVAVIITFPQVCLR